MVVARRFGDRLIIDGFWVPLVDGKKVTFLSLLDDASVYHVARHLADQSATTALDVIIDYWFAIFGPCDEIVVDAASAFLSEEFGQTLVAWGTRVRPIAGEAHWQLGKAETHGGCLKYMYTKTAEEFPSYTRMVVPGGNSEGC